MDNESDQPRGLSRWAIATGVFAVTAGFIGWLLGARGGRRQYQRLLGQLDQVLSQAQSRAQDAQAQLHDKTEDVADRVKGSSGHAQRKLKKAAKRARKGRR